MKYKTIGAFKNVQNIPYCKADVDLKIGMGIVVDRSNKIVKLPASADECKTVDHIVTNICDKPEIRNSDDFVVSKGEYVRADDLTTVAGMEIELSAADIATEYSTLTAGDNLVVNTTGKWEKATDVTGYKVVLKVIEKTAYMYGGVLAEITIQ